MEPPTRVKLICSWTPSDQIFRLWERQSQGNGWWDDLQLVLDYDQADFFAVMNFPFPGERIDPARTIVFPMEPAHGRTGWGYWNNPPARDFLRVMSHDQHYNNIIWHLSGTCSQLLAEPVVKTKELSSVTSDLVQFDGQRQRVEFLQALARCGVSFDLFGRGNKFQIPNYRGDLPPRAKDAGLLPYKYTFAGENCLERNYFTEKLTDAILAECLCFYWGCPNVSDYLDSRAFIPIDIEKPEMAIEIIKQAMAGNEWEKRIEIVRQEKRRIVTQLQFFPRLRHLLVGADSAKKPEATQWWKRLFSDGQK